MTLTGGNRPQWIQVGVADLASGPAEIISTERVEQMHLPAPFRRRDALGDETRNDGAGHPGQRQRRDHRAQNDRNGRRESRGLIG